MPHAGADRTYLIVNVIRHQTVRALLVGGPMYDSLYDRIPAFEEATGLRVEVIESGAT